MVRRLPVETAIPSLLLIAFGLVVWLTAFAGKEEPLPPFFDARAPDQISGVEAARAAIDAARNAVEDSSPSDDGLFAGPLGRVSVRYEPLGASAKWSVLIGAPIRVRPNTPEEFTTAEGLVFVEISAFTGEVAGRLSAGAGYSGPNGGPPFLLTSLGVSSAGFMRLPIDRVWPPEQ